jgi:hypothetical protein
MTLFALAGAGLAGCSGTDEQKTCSPGTLVDHEQWQVVHGAEDPFDSERPPIVNCSAEAARFEEFGGEPSFGVDTLSCDYVTVAQPSLRDVCAGDQLQIRIWHFELTAPSPGEAHIAVMLGEHSLFDSRYPIPSDSGLDFPVVTAPSDIAKGSPAVFHVHNHGDNSFNILELSIK